MIITFFSSLVNLFRGNGMENEKFSRKKILGKSFLIKKTSKKISQKHFPEKSVLENFSEKFPGKKVLQKIPPKSS